jgi:hypothetical protein
VRPVISFALVGLVGACAVGETPTHDDIMDASVLGGSSGSGAVTGGSFSQSGTATGGTTTAGSFNSGGETTGGFSTGGFITGGTFGISGSSTGGTPGSGGTAAGGSGGAGKAGAGGGGSGGKASGGAGGMPPNGNCGQDPLGPKADWEATASVHAMNCTNPNDAYCGPPERGIDGVGNNRYTTGADRTGTEWFQIDFGDTAAVSRVVLTTAASSSDYTRNYEVRMAATAGAVDGSAVIASGMGVQGTTTINFPSPKTGQFLRIYQKTATDGWWSLAEVDVSCQ